MSKLNIIPVFVPHYGCPNDCIFCNQKKITNKDYSDDLAKTRSNIEEHLSFFSNPNNKVQIAFYGGSFTGLNFNIMTKYLLLANEYIKNSKVDSIRISTRPDYINVEILEILKEFNVETIELGVQSLDEEVLFYNNRGHNAKIVYESSSLIKAFGFKLGLQQMIGLYKDDFKKDIFTTKEFIKINPDFVRIYPTLVIKETYLEKLYFNNKYKPLTIEEAIEIIKPLYLMYYLSEIDIIRIGLQPTENINEGKDIVDGPFHPAFRQLVVQDIYKEIISKELSNYRNIDNLVVYGNKSNISYLVGNKGINKKYFSNKFNIKSIRFISSEKDDFILEINGTTKEIDIKKYYLEYLMNLEV